MSEINKNSRIMRIYDLLKYVRISGIIYRYNIHDVFSASGDVIMKCYFKTFFKKVKFGVHDRVPKHAQQGSALKTIVPNSARICTEMYLKSKSSVHSHSSSAFYCLIYTVKKKQ